MAMLTNSLIAMAVLIIFMIFAPILWPMSAERVKQNKFNWYSVLVLVTTSIFLALIVIYELGN